MKTRSQNASQRNPLWNALVCTSLVLSISLPTRADDLNAGLSKVYKNCAAQSVRDKSWSDAVQCMDREYERLLKRMRVEQAKRLKRADGEAQKKSMQESQAFWEKHMQAECRSLWGPNSGDSRDIVSECHMLKTARRVMELENLQR